MKKGQLKIETVKILETISKHILESREDYDSRDLIGSAAGMAFLRSHTRLTC